MTVKELKSEFFARGPAIDGLRNVLLPHMQAVLDRYSIDVTSIKKFLAESKRMVMDQNFSAFAMGVYARLGADSVVRVLGDVSTPNVDGNNPPQFDLLKDVANVFFKERVTVSTE